jgi:micrococcal nuclease
VSVKSDHRSGKRHPLWCLFFVAISFSQNSVLASIDSLTGNSNPHCLHTAEALPASVARVTDGDTVVLTDGRRVRLIGINTLELNSSQAQDKAWALAAKSELEKQIKSKRVSLVLGIDEFDRHGRTLAHLQLADGSSAAETLISKGFGLSISVGSNHRCAHQYEQSEQLARHSSVGIWQNPGNWLSSDQKMTGRERGFRLVTSTVLKIHESNNRTTLELRNGLRVTLNKQFLAAPDYTSTLAQNLRGKRIEVRGWLGGESGKQNLTLSHPTNLRVLPY